MAAHLHQAGKCIMMMGHQKLLLVAGLMLLVGALFLFVSPSAYAQQQPAATCKDYAGLTNHIAGCVRATLDNATSGYFNSSTGFYSLVQKAIVASMTLAVTLFGALAAFGMIEKAGRDSIMLLVKIAAVAYFTTSSDYMYQQVVGAMDSTAQQVVSFVPSSGQSDNTGGDFSQIECMKKMTGGQQTQNGVFGPWLAMDCILDSVIGIKVEPKGGVAPNALSQAKAYNEKLKDDDKGLSRGLLYFFFSSYNSSVMGIMLAILGFIFIWGIISLIIKALFIYLAGYIGLAVMMMVAPLFIPMVLFQATRSYFDKWTKLIISFALQPIIILTFIVLTITAVDLATFSGNYSVMYRIAGEESRKNDFSLNNYLTCPRNKNNPATCLQSTQGMNASDIVRIVEQAPIKIGSVKADTKDTTPIESTMTGGILKGLENSKCTKSLMAQDPQLKEHCEQSYPLQLWRENINWDIMAQARNPGVTVESGVVNEKEQISKEVMAAVIFAAVVIFVMNGLLKVVPMVAYDLFGDFGSSPNLASAASSMPGQSGMKSKLSGMFGGGGGR